MPLHDKQRAKRRRKREFKKSHPDHAIQEAQRREIEYLQDEIRRLECLRGYGKKWARNAQSRERMSGFMGGPIVQDAIYVHKHPAVIDELRQKLAALKGEAVTTAALNCEADEQTP